MELAGFQYSNRSRIKAMNPLEGETDGVTRDSAGDAIMAGLRYYLAIP